ncbi:hypothetical protein [Paralysiella testudinis]|uniref:Uncharacterized protein n=1 Tax=Paralysiella testudinis TaxID=2809020 RepID=A0A892ZLT6_9NEIS|nr:hypothetical protein [Paralysiella testudinis]QRQ82544.1 hypothetical protein JQU52_03870 [Paralysiella testudinis]
MYGAKAPTNSVPYYLYCLRLRALYHFILHFTILFHYIVPFSAHKQAHAALKMRAKGGFGCAFCLACACFCTKNSYKKDNKQALKSAGIIARITAGTSIL